jgi:hypothetical protein
MQENGGEEKKALQPYSSRGVRLFAQASLQRTVWKDPLMSTRVQRQLLRVQEAGIPSSVQRVRMRRQTEIGTAVSIQNTHMKSRQ